ncbi:adenylate kinase family protein [Mycoplasma sp. 394]
MIGKIDTNIILMGQPGAGKGTVAGVFAKKTEWIHLSTGNIFRQEIHNKTQLGQKVEYYVNSGGYVPDEITNEIVKNAILKLRAENKFFILDGYPRTIAQAEFLKQIPNLKFKVILLTASEKIIMERLSGRLACEICGTGYHIKFKRSFVPDYCDIDGGRLYSRDDDKPEKIKNRLKIYDEQTKPLLEYYKKTGELLTFACEGDPEEVANEIASHFKIRW